METAENDGAAPSTQHRQVRPPIGALPSAVDVLLVGCGPGGATLAKLLARYGAHVLVVDKSPMFRWRRAQSRRTTKRCLPFSFAGLEERDFEPIAVPLVRTRSPTLGLFGGINSLGSQDGDPKLFARAGGHVVQIAHRGQRPHLARHDSWEDLESVFLPRLVPVDWTTDVRPDTRIVRDGPATEANRAACERLTAG